MFWKKLISDKNWQTEKWVLIALLASFILTGGVHFVSQRSILKSARDSELHHFDYDIANKLRAMENHLFAMESNVRSFIITQDRIYFVEIDRHMLAARHHFDKIKEMAGDLPETQGEPFLVLEKTLRQRIAVSNDALDSFHINGKDNAEHFIGSEDGNGAALEKDFSDALAAFLKEAGIDISKNSEQDKRNHEQAIYIDNAAYLLGMALLLIALIFLIKSLRKRMKLEAHLINAKNEVEKSAHIKEQFLANMSHEIRTPLQAILGYTNILGKEKLSEKQAQYVDNIQLAGENLLGIVNDILDVSKMESGMLRLEKTAFSVSGLLHSVDSMFQPKVAEKGIYLKVHSGPVPLLIGDPVRLTQILVNLIGNAIKFTEKGGIDIYIKTKNETAGKLVLQTTVKDTGIGILEEKQATIFERFEQADSKITRMYGGSGLGLHIVKKLVEAQGGNIWVENKMGEGSSFVFEIPYQIAIENRTKKSGGNGMVSLPENFNDIHILVVEDNLMNQRVISMFLSGRGLDFDIAENGKTAIQLLEKNNYDLVLMDVQMPEMDGYSATEYIRQNMQLRTPIVAMTAHAMAGEREKALSHGMDEYLSKPIREEDLFKIIARFVPLIRGNNYPPPASQYIDKKTPSSDGISIDYNFLMESSKGKKEYLRNILELFLEQAPRQLADMEKALADGRYMEVGKIAHSLKSTAGYAGLDDSFRPVLEYMEKTASSENPDEDLNLYFAKLKNMVEIAVEKIRTEALPLAKKEG